VTVRQREADHRFACRLARCRRQYTRGASAASTVSTGERCGPRSVLRGVLARNAAVRRIGITGEEKIERGPGSPSQDDAAVAVRHPGKRQRQVRHGEPWRSGDQSRGRACMSARR